MFRGTELVVAGKLTDQKSDFNSTLIADSTEGNFETPIMVSCFDIPIIPPDTVPQKRRIGYYNFIFIHLFLSFVLLAIIINYIIHIMTNQ